MTTLVERIARALVVDGSYLETVAETASYAYKSYRIPKRNGGERTIFHPARELKAIQRWLARNIVALFPLTQYAYAYRVGGEFGIHNNAKRHSRSKFLLRMDLANFFPSIKTSDIETLLRANAHRLTGWAELDTALFCKFVCRKGALTIGAPTSPALSNALCWDLDLALATAATTAGCTYTRYADDLFFSTTERDVLGPFEKTVAEIVGTLKCPAGLLLNSKKTRHFSRRYRREVTGIVLTSDGGTSFGRRVKRSLRAQIHQYSALNLAARRKLAGLLAQASSIEPELINELILKYGHDLIKKVRHPE
jgi:RNA-directed DNA polymerase